MPTGEGVGGTGSKVHVYTFSKISKISLILVQPNSLAINRKTKIIIFSLLMEVRES